jgi:hypothetical protein
MKVSAVNRRRLVILGALVLVFTVVGFLVLPPIIKAQLEKRMSAELGRAVTVEEVHVNPYALSLALDHFAIREKDGTSVFLAWRRLYVRLDPLRSLWTAWGLSEVDLDGFQVRVDLGADRAFNFADILARVLPPPGAPASSPGKPGRPITVGRLVVSGASLEFSDRSRRAPFATTVGPMTFTLSRFSTAPQVGAPYRFEAVTESGEKFAWSGTLQAEPLASVGDFRVVNLDLPKYTPYYADQVNADLTGGMLSVGGRYELSLDKDSPVMRLHDGEVHLRGLKLTERASHEVAIDLPVVDLVGIDADALARKAAVKAVTVTGGRVQVRRDKDGSINLLALLMPAEASAPAAPAAAAHRLPDASIDRITASNLEIDGTDLAGSRPARIGLKAVQFSLEKVSLAPGASMPLALAFNWSPQGAVKVGGEVSLLPAKADLKVDVAGLGLLPLSPYLEQFVNARVTQGALTANLAIQAKPGRGLPVVSVDGDVKLDDFGLVDAAHSDDLAGVRSVKVRGIRAATSPDLSLKVDEIAIDGPYLRGIVNPDRSVNLLTVVLPPGPAGVRSRAEPVSPGPTGRPKVEIGQVTLSGGSFRFVDRSLEPNAAMDIEQFGGTIKGLSSTHLAKAEVSLSAVVGQGGPVAIAGTLDPLGAVKRVDLTIDGKNIDLVPLSPYSGRFAGYELARGKLAVAVKLQVDNDRIDATNVVTLDRFTFGEPVASKDATALPVRLGVALLKDIDGKIVIDVPVQGRMDDPNFRIGRVVVRVIVNLLTKAAVSPFSLLGSMFGGGGDELAYQEFQPGSSALQPAEVKKLETMTRALANRPGLSLDLEGSYDGAADAYALKHAKLAADVRREIWTAAHQSDPNIAPPDQLVITPEQNAAMVKKLFDAKFPPGTQFGTPLPPAPRVAAPPPPPSSFLRRVAAMITLEGVRERRKAQGENDQRQAKYRQQVASAAAAGMPLAEMTDRLAEATEVTSDDLRALAADRAQRVRDYFVGTGHIDAGRLFLAKGAEMAKANKGPRVFLSLE